MSWCHELSDGYIQEKGQGKVQRLDDVYDAATSLISEMAGH
jgi:hypothetical protein